jgi:hypothetical protein
MPPVSVTIQPRNLPAEVPPVLLDDGEVADPHAVSTTSALAATAAMINFFNNYLPIMKGSAALRRSPTAGVARPVGREHDGDPVRIPAG